MTSKSSPTPRENASTSRLARLANTANNEFSLVTSDSVRPTAHRNFGSTIPTSVLAHVTTDFIASVLERTYSLYLVLALARNASTSPRTSSSSPAINPSVGCVAPAIGVSFTLSLSSTRRPQSMALADASTIFDTSVPGRKSSPGAIRRLVTRRVDVERAARVETSRRRANDDAVETPPASGTALARIGPTGCASRLALSANEFDAGDDGRAARRRRARARRPTTRLHTHHRTVDVARRRRGDDVSHVRRVGVSHQQSAALRVVRAGRARRRVVEDERFRHRS